MDLSGYIMDLESLINRYTILIIIKVLSVFLMLILVWLVPHIGNPLKKKHKTKRKIKIEKANKTKTVIGQIIISGLFIIVEIFIVGNYVDTLNNLKKDLNQNAFVVYNGDAYLCDDYRRTSLLFNLFVDSRNVNLGNSDDIYIIDMSMTDEGWFRDSGDFQGKITYGENSKFILKIE